MAQQVKVTGSRTHIYSQHPYGEITGRDKKTTGKLRGQHARTMKHSGKRTDDAQQAEAVL